MYVDIHTSMFKDYDYNWTVKAISMKNNMRQVCQLESELLVKVYNTCNVYRNIAISSQTNGDISFKKKSLKKNLHL